MLGPAKPDLVLDEQTAVAFANLLGATDDSSFEAAGQKLQLYAEDARCAGKQLSLKRDLLRSLCVMMCSAHPRHGHAVLCSCAFVATFTSHHAPSFKCSCAIKQPIPIMCDPQSNTLSHPFSCLPASAFHRLGPFALQTRSMPPFHLRKVAERWQGCVSKRPNGR